MRIIVCTKNDLPGALILNRLLPILRDHDLLVLLSDKTRAAETAVPELTELKFLERDLPVGTLFPQIDAQESGDGRAGGREGDGLLTFAGLERRYGLTFKTVDDINAASSIQLLTAFQPDLILSIRFSHIFKAIAYDIPRIGTFNVHPGALPHYAGLFAPFRAMMDNQERLGCTLHRVDAKIDTGPVLGIGWLPVEPERGLLWHILNTYDPGIDLLVSALDAWEKGRELPEHPQDFRKRAYRSMPDAEAFQTFHRRGYRLYDPAHYGDLLRRFGFQAVRGGASHAA